MRLLKLVPDDTNVNFLKLRVPFYVVSTLLIVLSWALVFTKGLNLGVAFGGGQMISVTVEKSAEAPVADMGDNVAKLGYGEPVIQRFGKPNEVSIRLRLPEKAETDAALSDKMTQDVVAAVRQGHPDAWVDGV